MKVRRLSKRTAYLVVGGAALAIAAGYGALALQLPFGKLDQPGAAVFPIVVTAIMAIAGVATLVEGWQMEPSALVELPAGQDLRRVAVLVTALVGYLVLLPWLGHWISSTLFLVATMRLLSHYTWVRVWATALVVAAAFEGLFVRLLQVPMPSGVLGF